MSLPFEPDPPYVQGKTIYLMKAPRPEPRPIDLEHPEWYQTRNGFPVIAFVENTNRDRDSLSRVAALVKPPHGDAVLHFVSRQGRWWTTREVDEDIVRKPDEGLLSGG